MSSINNRARHYRRCREKKALDKDKQTQIIIDKLKLDKAVAMKIIEDSIKSKEKIVKSKDKIIKRKDEIIKSKDKIIKSINKIIKIIKSIDKLVEETQ